MNTLSRGLSKKIIKEWIEDVYGSLQQGERSRGKTGCRCFKQEIQREESENHCAISVSRTHKGLEYCCFKPSCQLGSGIVGGPDGWAGFNRTDVPTSLRTDGDGKLLHKFALPQGVVAGATGSRFDWLQQFSIGRVEIARYSIGEHPADPFGLYFPIHDSARNYQGYVRRQIGAAAQNSDGGRSNPKWISHCPPGTMAFSRPQHAFKTLFVVEDVPSCIRLGKMVNSAALLGSNLTKYHIPVLLKELTSKKYAKVVIALDPDANDKAKKMQEVLTGVWQGVRVLKTTTDPKWWSDEQIKEVLQNDL